MKPLVSVIMPSFNAEKYIEEAIDSILHQTYNNLELIIVEDKSTDETLNVIKKYKDNRIKLLCNKCNMGIADSTNRGIRESKGKYIALLDDDDIAEKDRLCLQVDFLEQHTDIDILGGRTTFIDSNGKIMDYSNIPRNNPKYIKSVLLFNCIDFVNGTAMIRKKFIVENNLYYKNNCYGMQDYRFYIESSKVGKISTLSNFLLRYRIHEGSETEYIFKTYTKERAKVYASFQRYSLWESGFRLDENELRLINKVLAERNGKCESKKEFKELYWIFKKILKQGKAMNIDYFSELQHLCKVKLSEQIIRIDGFFE